MSNALPGVDIKDALKVRWVPQGWEWVDPLKDAQADALAVESGFRSRAEVIAERGRDAEEVDAEIAADAARAESLGILQSSKSNEVPVDGDA